MHSPRVKFSHIPTAARTELATVGGSVTGERQVALYGDFSWDYLASSFRRGFEQAGWRVIPLDVRDSRAHLAPWMRHRVGHRLTIRSLALRRLGSRRWNAHVLRAATAQQADLTLILNGEFLMPETLRRLRERGMPVFLFHADNPFPPNYNNRPETLPSALETDCYFVWSPMLGDRLKALGVPRVEYLPFAWDPEVFPFAEDSSAGQEHEVVFIGGWDAYREKWLTPIAKRFNLKVWGPDYWGTRTQAGSPLRHCWQGASLRGPEASRELRRAKIALNVLREQNDLVGTNMRTFELAGCGAFSLASRTKPAQDIFPEGEAAAYFRTPEELHSQIERYLADGEARHRMIAAARHTATQGHQYVHRARQLVATLDKLRNAV
jgi:spore maturation protein CgeB